MLCGCSSIGFFFFFFFSRASCVLLTCLRRFFGQTANKALQSVSSNSGRFSSNVFRNTCRKCLVWLLSVASALLHFAVVSGGLETFQTADRRHILLFLSDFSSLLSATSHRFLLSSKRLIRMLFIIPTPPQIWRKHINSSWDREKAFWATELCLFIFFPPLRPSSLLPPLANTKPPACCLPLASSSHNFSNKEKICSK